MVLVSEPVRGRSRATELPCYSVIFCICLRCEGWCHFGSTCHYNTALQLLREKHLNTCLLWWTFAPQFCRNDNTMADFSSIYYSMYHCVEVKNTFVICRKSKSIFLSKWSDIKSSGVPWGVMWDGTAQKSTFSKLNLYNTPVARAYGSPPLPSTKSNTQTPGFESYSEVKQI